MTIDDLLTQLSVVSDKLDSAPDDESKLALHILVFQLRKQAVAEAFDSLTELGAASNVEQLQILIPQVDQAIADEQQRTRVVAQIVSFARIALLAAGVRLTV